MEESFAYDFQANARKCDWTNIGFRGFVNKLKFDSTKEELISYRILLRKILEGGIFF